MPWPVPRPTRTAMRHATDDEMMRFSYVDYTQSGRARGMPVHHTIAAHSSSAVCKPHMAMSAVDAVTSGATLC